MSAQSRCVCIDSGRPNTAMLSFHWRINAPPLYRVADFLDNSLHRVYLVYCAKYGACEFPFVVHNIAKTTWPHRALTVVFGITAALHSTPYKRHLTAMKRQT